MISKPYIKSIKVSIGELYTVPQLIDESIREWWDSSYLSDLDVEKYIPYVIDEWEKRYVNNQYTKEAIEKIIESYPPLSIKMYLIIELINHDGYLKTDNEINTIPEFRPYIKGKYSEFALDTYVYNPEHKKFESLEIIEPETLEEEEVPIETISDFYAFHNRLLQTTQKKIKLYTSQPEERIYQWNKQGYIPKGSYLTDRIERAEYYYNPEEHDIIVSYRIPENKVVMTSDFGGAKEYSTIENVEIV